ncbi:MAG TPA: Cj0069 family protein [Gaiellaceae bacterium]|nr:Cj0069 family protein [Gaiellaceae bacterium]
MLERLSAAEGPLVLKQYRGMGGNGVWKVEVVEPGILEVQHAVRDAVPERLPLAEFVRRCEGYFAGDGRMVEQPFQPRLDEGMIRVYMTHDEVVGFALQYPQGLLPPSTGDPPKPPKRFEEASAPAYQDVKAQMESEWMPELKRILGIETYSLPVIWDADFLRGEDDRYVLCEINVSSTFAFPEHATPTVARAALARIGA